MPTQSATAASSWLLMPKSGQSELMPPQRIDDALHQEVAPARDDQRRRERWCWDTSDVRPSGCPDVADQFLEHEAADAGAGVDAWSG